MPTAPPLSVREVFGSTTVEGITLHSNSPRSRDSVKQVRDPTYVPPTDDDEEESSMTSRRRRYIKRCQRLASTPTSVDTVPMKKYGGLDLLTDEELISLKMQVERQLMIKSVRASSGTNLICGSPKGIERVNLVTKTSLPQKRDQPIGEELVERLVDRLRSATLVDDRLGAMQDLKSISRKYRLEVGMRATETIMIVIHPRYPEKRAQ